VFSNDTLLHRLETFENNSSKLKKFADLRTLQQNAQATSNPKSLCKRGSINDAEFKRALGGQKTPNQVVLAQKYFEKNYAANSLSQYHARPL
jgi:hypothetical protein